MLLQMKLGEYEDYVNIRLHSLCVRHSQQFNRAPRGAERTLIGLSEFMTDI